MGKDTKRILGTFLDRRKDTEKNLDKDNRHPVQDSNQAYTDYAHL
jgi:hypothetical protein